MNIKVSKDVSVKQEKEFLEATLDNDYNAFIKKLKINKEDAKKNTIKLFDSIEELNNCKKCSNLYECKNRVSGHVFFPSKKESHLQFSYIPCKFQKRALKDNEEKSSSQNILKNARMKDIKITKNRRDTIKWIKNYYDNYDLYKTTKGLYLHGNFGTGKSFLVASLLNELENKYKVRTEIVYFPELLRKLKENLNLVNEKIEYLESIDVLLLDDIGAEKVTEWGRDEVLGTILQTRMNNGMPTFFTSNLTISELEKHLSITKEKEDALKAKRIIERIKYITDDIELLGNNYRESGLE